MSLHDDAFDANPYAPPKADLVFDDLPRDKPFFGYGGFWIRAVAFLIDYIVTYVIGMVLNLAVMGIVMFGLGGRGEDQTPVWIAVYAFNVLIGIAVGVAYYAGMESSSSQATLGKMALGLKVTDLFGRRITFWRAVGRYASKIVSGMILGIGYFMAGFTERKQGLHDMMAGTLVVRSR